MASEQDDSLLIVVAPAQATIVAEQEAYAAAAEHLMKEESSQQPFTQLQAMGARLVGEFRQAVLDRQDTEKRWLQDLRQYKGQYDPDIEAKLKGRSKSFVRKTRVKVKTTDSRVADMLFPAGGEKNWEIGPTPEPTISPLQKQQVQQLLMQQRQQMAMAAQMQAQQQGQAAQPVQLPPISESEIRAAIIELTKESSKRMAKVIEDQLIEANYKKACIKAIHSGHLYGTGIIKGPLIERRVRTQYQRTEKGWENVSVEYITPFVDWVPVWRFYPDMHASDLQDCRYVYELHRMTLADMADLARRKSFNRVAIQAHVEANPNGSKSLIEQTDTELKQIGLRNTTQADPGGTYEVLERWGWLSGRELQEAGVNVPAERVTEAFFSNVWLLPSGEVIKAVLQPINGVTWPYHIYYFDKDETSIFGEGIPSIMRDDQDMLNAGTRMILDNAGLTAGPMFEVFPHLLSGTDDPKVMAPWKVFMRSAASPEQRAVRVIDVPSKLNEMMAIVNKFELNADETTAIPRYMTGDNVTSGAASTMGGMSMLMGAANIVLKDLVSSWDEVTKSFIKSMHHWNMQFHKDDSIKGDFDIHARGSSSMVAREVRAQQLENFAAQTANPMDAPFVKRDKLLRLRAEVVELSDVVRTEDELNSDPTAKMQQEMAMQAQRLQLAQAEAAVLKAQADSARAMADAERSRAQVALLRAEAVDRKVESVFAALQAAGIAVQQPLVAAAGDEILRSAGWQDETPDPSIAQISNLPVAPGQAQPMPQPEGTVQPDTGRAGVRQGIETARID